MHCAEYRDVVAAHVDGALTAEELALALAHIADCAQCAGLLQAQQDLRQALRARAWIRATPADVRQRVLAAIDAGGGATSWIARLKQWWVLPWSRVALAGAIAALAIMVAVPLLRLRSRGPLAAEFDTIVADFRAAQAETVKLEFHTDDPYELRESYHRTGAIPFNNSVVDLEPLGYILAGGSVVNLGTVKSTMTVYRGPHGLLLCHRILAGDLKYPPGGEYAGGDAFYTVGGITICMHREGDVMCFMASAMPRAEFIKHMLMGMT
jgi:anti-sigma factor RsiW